MAVKAEFEAEGTRVDELLRLLELARRTNLAVVVKIGGCEAMRDLYDCRSFGVDYVVAPMVETPYALSKYRDARARAFSEEELGDLRFLFNVETITAFNNIPDLASMAQSANIGIVFGRVDFAGSLGLNRSIIESYDMTKYVLKVARAARDCHLDMVVGGGISVASIPNLRQIREVRLDRFETRKIVFDAAVLDGDRAESSLALAIEFELLWLRNKREFYRSVSEEDESRIAFIEARRGNGLVSLATE